MNVLFVDDSEPLIASIKEWAERHGHVSADFYTSLKGAQRAVEERDFSRVVVDYDFAEEARDGISFLESIRDRRPDVDLVLLTGEFIGPRQLARLREIEAVLVDKSSLDSQLLESILTKVQIGGKSELQRSSGENTRVSHAQEAFSCFVSHSSRDEIFARKLYVDLQRSGVDCWFAPEDMRAGDRIRETIAEHVYTQEKLLLILSQNSIASHWVETEVEAAFSKEREADTTVLIPIRVDSAISYTKKAWAAEILRTRHIQDFSGWEDKGAYQRSLEKLLRAVRREGPPNASTSPN